MSSTQASSISQKDSFLIKRAVRELLAADDPRAQAQTTLLNFALNTRTVDSVISIIMEAVRDTSPADQHAVALARGVRFLKLALPESSPSRTMLSLLEKFCLNEARAAAPPTQRSLQYVRATLARQHNNNDARPVATDDGQLFAPSSTAADGQRTASKSRSSKRRSGFDAESSLPDSVFPCNFLVARMRRQPSWRNSSPAARAEATLFGVSSSAAVAAALVSSGATAVSTSAPSSTASTGSAASGSTASSASGAPSSGTSPVGSVGSVAMAPPSLGTVDRRMMRPPPHAHGASASATPPSSLGSGEHHHAGHLGHAPKPSMSSAGAAMLAPASGGSVAHNEVFMYGNFDETMARVRTVCEEKKKEEKRDDKRTVRRKGAQLFQYKYYREQVPLSLSAAEMDQVVAAAVNPPADDPEARLTASKILIKLMLDMYSGDEKPSAALVLAIMTEMLSSPSVDARIHSFNMLFNLSLHINMLDETALLAECNEAAAAGRERVKRIQGELSDICHEMCVFLLHAKEPDDRVWSTALSCLLYFVTAGGQLTPAAAASLDPRLFPEFLRHLGAARDDMHRRLVRAMVASLYPLSRQRLDHKRLDRIGLTCIVHHFSTARSLEARQNLFLVLFDTVCQQHIARSARPDGLRQQQLLSALWLVDAPLLCQAMFKVCPESFATRAATALSEAVASDKRLNESAGGVPPELVAAFFTAMEKLARRHGSVESEFTGQVATLTAPTANATSIEEARTTLRTLLFSANEAARMQALNWLTALHRCSLTRALAKPVSAMMDDLYTALIASPQPAIRALFLHDLERRVLLGRYRANGAAAALRDMGVTLNAGLVRLLAVERNDANLLHAFDVLFSFVYLPMQPPTNTHCTLEAPEDSNAELFMRNRATISLPLLGHVSTQVLHLLYVHLPPRTHTNLVNPYATPHVALLLMLMEKCKKKSELEQVGLAFFRQSVQDPNPEVAYHASRFLVDQLRSEKPAEFTAMFSTLAKKAQQTNDEMTLVNAYLQIVAISKMQKSGAAGAGGNTFTRKP